MKALILVFFLYSEGLLAGCLSGSLEVQPQLNFDLKGVEQTVLEFENGVRPELSPDVDLVINLLTLNARVNAEINKNEDAVVIDVMGGMLAHPKMSPDVLNLLLCHELGHLLGGAPLKSRNGWSATEGQADYFSGGFCARTFIPEEDIFLNSALALTQIYAEVTREAPPKLDSCDQKKVDRTNYGYPSVQCRLDTLIAGWSGKPRPACWFRN